MKGNDSLGNVGNLGTLRAAAYGPWGEYFAKFGRKGGKATARKLSPERRKEIARKAAQTRWAKRV